MFNRSKPPPTQTVSSEPVSADVAKAPNISVPDIPASQNEAAVRVETTDQVQTPESPIAQVIAQAEPEAPTSEQAPEQVENKADVTPEMKAADMAANQPVAVETVPVVEEPSSLAVDKRDNTVQSSQNVRETITLSNQDPQTPDVTIEGAQANDVVTVDKGPNIDNKDKVIPFADPQALKDIKIPVHEEKPEPESLTKEFTRVCEKTGQATSCTSDCSTCDQDVVVDEATSIAANTHIEEEDPFTATQSLTEEFTRVCEKTGQATSCTSDCSTCDQDVVVDEATSIAAETYIEVDDPFQTLEAA